MQRFFFKKIRRILSTLAVSVGLLLGSFGIALALTTIGTNISTDGTFTVNGNATLGDAIGDTLTIDAGAWTLTNAVDVTLNNAVDSLNFDSNTLSIDALNNRVGIGTSSPNNTIQVVDLIDFNNTNLTTFLGYQAGNVNTGTSGGTFVGYQAGLSNTTGNANTAVGYQALWSNTTALNNSAFGYLALNSNTTGASNTASGRDALWGNTTGSSNTAIGRTAGDSNTTGSNNTFLGHNADATLNNLTNATAIGANASVATSDSLILGGTGANAVNVGIGTATPTSKLSVQGVNSIVTFGSNLVASGPDTFDSSTGWITGAGWSIGTDASCPGGGANPCAIHTAADANLTYDVSVTSGNSYQIIATVKTATIGSTTAPMVIKLGTVSAAAVGQKVGTLNSYDVVLTANTTGTVALTFDPDVAWVGYIDTVSVQELTGSDSLIALENSDNTVGVEMRSGGSNNRNTYLGFEAGQFNDSGPDYFNTAVGYQSFFSNIWGDSDTAIGYQSLFSNTSGTNNTAVGKGSLYSSTTASQNNAFGYHALNLTTTGRFNAAFGTITLDKNTTGDRNSAFGESALGNNTTASNNSALGASSGGFITTGSNNTAIGYNAGLTITTGSDNTFLGYQADATSATFTNATAIGANASVGCSNCLVLGSSANVGIGDTTPDAKLDVAGSFFAGSASQFQINSSGQMTKFVQAGVTADAGDAQGGSPITADLVEVATAGANDSVTLPTAAAGLQVIVTNHGAASLDLFPASGDAINEATVDTAKAVAANATVLCYAYDATNWECLTLAR